MRRFALLALVVLTACAKAAYLPNPNGGYTLMTKVGSMEDAVTRFRRTADGLCDGRPYAMSTPTIVTHGWGMFGSEIDVQAELACQ